MGKQKKSNLKLNFIYNMMYTVLNTVLPLLTSPYVSRKMGAESLGIYSYSYSIANYFNQLALLGIQNYGNRNIAKVRDDQEKLNRTFSGIYYCQLLVGGVTMLCYVLYACFFAKGYKNIFFILGLMVICKMFDFNWLFFGLEEFRILVPRNFIIKISSFVCIFVFIKRPEDVWIYTLIMSLAVFVSDLMLIPYLPRFVKFQKVPIKEILSHLKPNFILFIPIISTTLYRSIDKVMLGNMIGYVEVGYYENCEKIIGFSLGTITALGQVMLPRMSNLIASGQIEESERLTVKSIKFATIMSVSMLFGIIGVSERFVPFFFGEEFLPCILTLSLLAPNLFLLAWGNVLKTQYLIPNEKDKIYIWAVITGVVVNIPMNFVLIPSLGANGAVIATLIAELVSLVIIVMNTKMKLPYKECAGYLLCGVIMCLVVLGVGKINMSNTIGLVVQMVIGVCVFFAILLLMLKVTRDDFYEEILKVINGVKAKVKH